MRWSGSLLAIATLFAAACEAAPRLHPTAGPPNSAASAPVQLGEQNETATDGQTIAEATVHAEPPEEGHASEGLKVSGVDAGEKMDVPPLPPAPSRVRLAPLRNLSHGGDVLGVAFSPDGQKLASAANDGVVRVWDVTSGRLMKSHRRHADGVTSVAWSPGGDYIASTSFDGTVKLWNVAAASERWSFTGGSRMREVRFHPDGSVLASGDKDQALRLDASTGRILAQFDSSKAGGAWGMDVSAGGEWIATIGDGHLTTLYVEGMRPHRTDRAHSSAVWGVAFSPCGDFVVYPAQDSRSLSVLHMSTGRRVARLAVPDAWLIPSVDWSSTGLIAAGDSNGRVSIFRPQQSEPLATAKEFQKNIIAVDFSPDGSLLAAGGYDNSVRLWRVTAETPTSN